MQKAQVSSMNSYPDKSCHWETTADITQYMLKQDKQVSV